MDLNGPEHPVDSWGQVFPSYNGDENLNRRGELASHIINVDSRARNRNRYPNANNFIVNMPVPFKYVLSIELLNATVPIPDPEVAGWNGVAPRYFVIRSNILEQLEGAETTNPAQTAFFDVSGNPISYHGTITNRAFVTLPVLNNFPSHFNADHAALYWRKSECRVIKRFFPPRATIDSIDIQLFFPNNVGREHPWPFTDENPDPTVATSPELNVLFTFEVVCKN